MPKRLTKGFEFGSVSRNLALFPVNFLNSQIRNKTVEKSLEDLRLLVTVAQTC